MECRRGLAMRILSVCLSVRLSVRLSNAWIVTDVQMFIPHERSFSLVFQGIEWLVGDDPFYLKLWGNRPPLERNCRFSVDILSQPDLHQGGYVRVCKFNGGFPVQSFSSGKIFIKIRPVSPEIWYDNDDDVQWFNAHLKADWKPA